MTRPGVLVVRALGFLALWLVLMPSAKPADLAFGLFAALLATWASAILLPADHGHIRLYRLAALLPHFLWESIKAGIDVARRAFDPALPLDPGFVRYRTDMPAGFACNTFATFTSLMPGSLPCGEEDGMLVYHALDVGQPVTEGLAKEQRYLAAVLLEDTDA
jgi:multicomponent Na+:H+ antiporter subunit E